MNQHRILVIDDSEDIRYAFRVVLETAGYDVKTASDGQAGLEATQTFRPDLIITDLSMPGMDGLEFLVRLRSDLAPPIPWVIVCSGFDTTVDEALRLGATCFVAKPVEPDALLSIVAQVLEGRAPDARTLARERALAREAGTRASEAAARMMATLATTTPSLEEVLARFTQRLADYFDVAPACVVVLDGAELKVIGASRGCPVPVGARLSSTAPFANSILAARSSLVLPDARAFGPLSLDGRASGVDLGFLVAVPLVFEDVPIGALALLASDPRSFSSEDLTIVEAVGHLASRRLNELSARGAQIVLWPPALFERVLTAETSLLHRERGGLELVLVDVEEGAVRSEALLAVLASGGRRFAACQRAVETLAISRRDPNAALATSEISRVLAAISSSGALRAAGWVSVIDDGIPLLPADVVFQLAVRALDQARATPGRPVQRLVLSAARPTLEPAFGAPAG